LGLLGYAIGASAMALAQGLSAVIVFWAVLGGIGASLLLPATVLPPADQQRVAQALEENAQFVNTQLAQLLVNQPPGDSGRDHPHQYGIPTARPSGATAHSHPRRADRAVQLVPHDAPARSHSIGRRGRNGHLLTSPRSARAHSVRVMTRDLRSDTLQE
jgi:hypothetical protein